MLDVLRKSASSWVAKGLFVMLIIAFGAWGIGDYLRPNPNRAVATVGDEEISPREFTEAYRPALAQLSQRFGQNITSEMAQQLGLPQEVLHGLVVRRLLQQEARRLGVLVGDDEIRAAILANPAFHGAGGGFDRARFEMLLRNNGLSEAGYVALLRSQLTARALSGSVAAPAEVPQSMAEAVFRFRGEKRAAELMLLPESAAPVPPPASDADLEAYYEAHKEEYRAPEYRALTLLAITPDELAPQHQPKPEDVRAAYQSRIAEFRVPGTRTVTQLLYTDQAKADEAQKRLAAGETAAAVAKETGGQLTELGKLKETELFPKELATAAFALQSPGVAAPVKTALGWHVLEVTALEAGHEQPFDAVKDKLAGQLAREAATDAIPDLANRIEDKMAGGATLDETAKELGLKLDKIPAVDREGKDPAGKPVATIPAGSDVLTAAFDTPQGETTPIADLPDGGLYVAQVDKVEPSHIRPLEAVRERIVEAVAHQRREAAGREEADGLAEQVRKGETMAEVAQGRGLTVRTPAPFLRTANDPASWLPASLVTRVFGAKEGDVVVAASPEGHIVARVTKIEIPDPAAAKEQVEALRKALSEPLSGDLEQEYTNALQSRYGVSVDQSMLQRLL